MSNTTYFTRLRNGSETRYYRGSAPLPLNTQQTVYPNATEAEYLASLLNCAGTGEDNTVAPDGITVHYLQYDSTGLVAVVRADVATEVRFSLPSGQVTSWLATTAFGGAPALPAAGSYRYVYENPAPGAYVVTYRQAGSSDASKYLTDTYTVPGSTPPPATTDGGVNFVVPFYTVGSGLNVGVNARVANQVQVFSISGAFGDSGYYNTVLPDGGTPPPGTGTYYRFYGELPAGQYGVRARPTGSTTESQYRVAYFTVAGPVSTNILTGYKWDGAPSNHSFEAVAAVTDNDTYEFYMEPLDGQSPPIAGFQFLPMNTVSKTVAGQAVNRSGFHGPIFQGYAGVASGRWKLHVQKTGRPETRDTRFVTLVGNAGEESDVGDGVASTKPIWGSATPPAMHPGTAWEWVLPAGSAYNPDNTAAGIFADLVPSWISSELPATNALRLFGTVPSYLTDAVDIRLNAVGPGGITPKTFRPDVAGSSSVYELLERYRGTPIVSSVTKIGYTWAKNNPTGGQPSVAGIYAKTSGITLEMAIEVVGVGGKSSYGSMNAGSYQSGDYDRFTTHSGAGSGQTAKYYFRQVGTTTDLAVVTLPAFPTSGTIAFTQVYP